MALEVERKYCHVDFARLRARLRELGASDLGRYFERNVVYESDPPALLAQKKLLRLRSCFQAGQAPSYLLTLKAPVPEAKQCAGCKVRREDEVQVSSAETMDAILQGQGFLPFACYEKIREAWQAGDLAVDLDILPFGHFVELEGEVAAIETWACDLELADAVQSTQSYHALYQDWLRKMGLHGGPSFVFSEALRQIWAERLGLGPLPALPDIFRSSAVSCLNEGAGV